MNYPYNVAIAIRSFDLNGPAFKLLKRAFKITFINKSGIRLNESELINALKDVHAVIAGTELYNKNVIDSSPNLKIISRVGVGIDNIDLKSIEQYGVKISNTSDAPVQAVAEHTLALLLTIVKRTGQYYEKSHRGDYSIESGSLIAGKNVGIIGFGRIGQRLAAILECLGCNILYFDPYVNSSISKKWKSASSLNELLNEADIISLHASAQSNHSPLLSKREFDRCKRGVIILNTARGSLIDEGFLVNALETGQISAAGLDVSRIEPYKGPLLSFPQVVITPHVASNTLESRQQMEIEAVKNIIKTFEEMNI